MAQRQIKVRVVPERCQGHARCSALAPELFEIDAIGNGHARGAGFVPLEHEDKAYLAQSNCPENAIEIKHG